MSAKWLTPVITVFDKDGNIDYKGNERVWDHIIAGGIDGLVILGSTGEFFALTLQEKKALIAHACRYLKGRTELIFGTGCENMEDTVSLSNFALEHGADAVMVVSPYYFSLSQQSLEKFYDDVAEGINGDMYLYNYPDRTVHSIAPETAYHLAMRHKNIIGVKDSVGPMDHTRRMIDLIKPERPDFIVYCGLDENFAHNVLSGGNGAVGGLSNVMPRLCADMKDAVNAKDFEKVAVLQQKINRAVVMYGVSVPYIPAVKTVAKLLNIIDCDACRTPIIACDAEQTAALDAIIKSV